MGTFARAWWSTLVVIAVLGAPLVAAAESVGVNPTEIDFGCVVVGDSSAEALTIMSEGPTPLAIESVEIVGDDADAFEITAAPPIPPLLPAGESLTFEITFTPPAETTFASAVLVVSDNIGGDITVDLFGEGAEGSCDTTPADLVDALQATVDAAVDDGDLVGTGRNARVRAARLALFQRKIEMVAWFVDAGLIMPACRILRWLDRRSDGERRPFDFVEGPAVEDVNAALGDVRDALGCASHGVCRRR